MILDYDISYYNTVYYMLYIYIYPHHRVQYMCWTFPLDQYGWAHRTSPPRAHRCVPGP